MRSHTCAAILLGGWLLMQPPIRLVHPEDPQAIPVPDARAPVSEWVHAGAHDREAYDTAAECERDRKKLEWLSKVGDEARCVPTEAVYPAQIPAQK